MNENQAKFDGWAIVDVLGHQRYVGYVTTEAYGQAVLFRVDVPAARRTRARDETSQATSPMVSYLPAGATVKEGAVDGYTKLMGSGSIYTFTPCTKDAALAAVEEAQVRPLMSVSLPEGQLLPEAAAPADDFADEDDDVEYDQADAR
jgi:hypothetical protein